MLILCGRYRVPEINDVAMNSGGWPLYGHSIPHNSLMKVWKLELIINIFMAYPWKWSAHQKPWTLHGENRTLHNKYKKFSLLPTKPLFEPTYILRIWSCSVSLPPSNLCGCPHTTFMEPWTINAIFCRISVRKPPRTPHWTAIFFGRLLWNM